MEWYCTECLKVFSVNKDVCPTVNCTSIRPSKGWGRVLKQGDIFANRYSIHELLAVGGSGITYLGQAVDNELQLSGPLVAIKVIFPRRDDEVYLDRLKMEAEILQQLQHENIIGYMHFDASDVEYPYLVTVYAEGGSLFHHLKANGVLTVQESAQIGMQLCNALQKTHEKGIIHRDLKPENILLRNKFVDGDSLEVLVADFGIAKLFDTKNLNATATGGFVGTPMYAAPEQFMGEGATVATDIYSLSAVLLFCVTGQHAMHYATALPTYSADDIWELYSQKVPPQVEIGNSSEKEVAAFQKLLDETMRVDARTRCNLLRYRELLESILMLDEGYQSAKAVHVAPLPMNRPVQAFDLVQPEIFEDETRPMERSMLDEDPTVITERDEAREVTEKENEDGKTHVLRRKGILSLMVVFFGALTAWIWLVDHTVVLTGKEADQQMQKDYAAMYDSLERILKISKKNCKVPEGETILFSVRVESNGRITKLRLRDNSSGLPIDCLRSELIGRRIARAQSFPIWMPKYFTW